MHYVSKKCGLWLVCVYVLTGCISISPAIPTSRPTMELPALRPTATGLPTPLAPPTMTEIPTQSAQMGMDAATFIKETYPDYSVLAPGEKFVKTWDIKNIGTNTWNTNYVLVLDATPQNNSLGSPAVINFPQETPPGETVTLSVPLIASTSPGTYSVYWRLKNDRGESFGVDGDRVWVIIMVCEAGSTCSPAVAGGSTSSNGVSATLTSFSSDAQSSTVRFCMTLPNRNYAPASATSVSLIVDQRTIPATGGGTLGVGCFEFGFSVTAPQIQQAKMIAVSIAEVRMVGGPNDPDGACQSARSSLVTEYPGLDFQCRFSMAGYFADLQLPAGMTLEQAQQIIVDKIEGAIYGPWVLNIKG